jgi:hypothetical protein
MILNKTVMTVMTTWKRSSYRSCLSFWSTTVKGLNRNNFWVLNMIYTMKMICRTICTTVLSKIYMRKIWKTIYMTAFCMIYTTRKTYKMIYMTVFYKIYRIWIRRMANSFSFLMGIFGKICRWMLTYREMKKMRNNDYYYFCRKRNCFWMRNTTVPFSSPFYYYFYF